MDWQKISDLAEFIAEENQSNGLIRPEIIARKKGIRHSYGDYGDCFVGLLEHRDNEFHVYLNSSKIRPLPDPRTRFTFAHELGHFFIDSHRVLLEKGVSLSFSDRWNIDDQHPVEREANHFASHLLLPQFLVDPIINKTPRGMSSLLAVKERLNTSISCTASKFIQHAPYACAALFFTADRTFFRIFKSRDFQKLFGNVSLRIEHDRIKVLFDEADKAPFGIIPDEICFAYNWFDGIAGKAKRDLVFYQELLKQGDYGYLMLIQALEL